MRAGSWNVEQRLTLLTDKERGTPNHILQGIEALDADVLVLPEAFQNAPAAEVDERLHAMGYDWRDVAYHDKGREQEYDGAMPYMRILSRLAIVASEEVRWADIRNTLVVTVQEPETGELVRVVGVHWDDREKATRRQQAYSMGHYIQQSDRLPTIAAGDWNEMHGVSRKERLLGSSAVRFIADHIPHATVRYIATRMVDMTEGDGLAEFEHITGMRDLDPLHRPTSTPKIRGPLEVLPSIPTIQIDHIYANDAIQADPVQIGRDGGADHRSVITNIQVT